MLQLQRTIVRMLNVVWIIERMHKYREYWNKSFLILFISHFKNAITKFEIKRSLSYLYLYVSLLLPLSLSLTFSTWILDNLQLKYFLQFFSLLFTRLMSTLRHFQSLLLSDLNVTICSRIFFFFIHIST